MKTTTTPRRDEWLSTTQAAELLGSTRQHVVNLCDRGDLPCLTVGTHRRVLQRDIDELIAKSKPLTRDQERSLWLNHIVAAEVARDPERAIRLARNNLVHLQSQNPRGQVAKWLSDWDQLLDKRRLNDLLSTLTSPSPHARELRQNSPFAGVVSNEDRTRVLRNFREAATVAAA